MRQKERDILGYYLGELFECEDSKTLLISILVDKLSGCDAKFKDMYGDLYERYKERQQKEQGFEGELESVAEKISGTSYQLSKRFTKAQTENYHDVREKYFPEEYEELF